LRNKQRLGSVKRAVRRATLRRGRAPRVMERRKVEKALRESEERFRSIAERNYDAIAAIDTEGRFTFVSPSVERIAGYRPKQLVGVQFQNFVPEFEMPKVVHAFDSMMKGENIEGLQLELKKKDGSLAQVEVDASPIRRNGRVVGMQGIIRDITERKQAEVALRESEERFRLAMDATSDGLWDWNVETGEIYFSPAYTRMLGYEPGELSGLAQSWMDFIHPDDRDAVLGSNQDCIQNRVRNFTMEFRMRTRSGGWKWILGRGHASARDAKGQALRMIGTHQDITERKAAEEELRKLSQFRETIIDNADVWLDVLDEKANVVIWNKAAVAISGYSREEVIGHDKIWEWLYPDKEYRKQLTNSVAEVRRGRVDQNFETTIRRKDGQTRIISWNERSLLDEHGRPVGSIALGSDITERQRAEEALKESEQRFRAIFDGVNDGILVADVKTRKFHVGNNAICRMLGCRPEDVKNLGVLDIHPEESLPYVTEQFDRLARHEIGVATEIPVKRRDGTVFYADISSSFLTLAGRTHLVGVFRDVTERKRAEEALANERNVLRTLIDTLPDNIFIKDAESRFVTTNLVHVHHLRAKTLDEIVGKTDFDIYPRELAAGYYADEQEVIRSGQPLVNREERTIDPEGKTRWLLTTKVPLRDDQGNVVGIVGVNRDITERKHMEEKLRQYSSNLEQIVAERTSKLAESERRFRELADLLPQIVFETDENGNIQFMNRSGFEATGRTEEELRRGLNIFQTFAADDRATERIGRMMTGEKLGGREVTVLRRDGTTFPAIAYAAPIMREGKAVGLRGIAVDITERKKLEAQLVESQRLAAIGETATMVGHDLRNPLQAMTNTLYVAKRLATSEKTEDRKGIAGLLDTLDDAIEYMDKIVSDLQDYARPVGADRVETSLPDLIRDSVSSVKIPRNVEVTVNVEDGLSNVKLDPALFRRVLTNLILNAVQAMPKGGKLTIASSRGDGSLTVAVQDTGVGIAPENLGRVFAPFFTTKAKGQGLGLAVCKRLTEAQDGTITVTSEVGKGSTFTLKIPTN
jgi:PAS domain S-box-containing protein